MRKAAVRLLWRALAVLSVVLAVLGTVLPVMPTVPFLIMAAWAGGKGWPALETWLLEHAHFGPHIRDWRARGAVPRRAKWLATVMMMGSATMMQFTPLPLYVRIGVPAVMAAVAVWLWRRPEP
ncbi:YbaN family protein [Roseateles sp. DC23W]|uniref:YbaN family protein n=1 Tax=Pelomonas dachongensis TaxID=3299029 RepID=A0ABW7EUQ0_9BURK